ncbi:alpha/beta hydrolase [Streptomyces atratus]|uniref:alpha/beta hydrolase n=1 Tax=Streptomyces TaxID=1883 RepID=UPI00379DDBEC
MHRALRGSRMVAVAQGEGHGVYPFKSCADKSATVYLTTGRLPAKDLTCQAPAGQREKSRKLRVPTPPGTHTGF